MTRARNEDGFAVVAAIVLLTVIMGLGLGLLLFTDAQQKASTREQASEAAFTVAEAALNAQIGQLDRNWPENAEQMPSTCTTSVSTATNDCPSPTDLKLDPNTSSTTCSGTDAWGSPLSNQWTTYVREDPGESPLFNSTEEKEERSFTSETGALWVRAVGVVQCHPVVVISLVTRQRITMEFPKDAIAGNWFEVTNKGEKVIVDRKGRASEAAPVSMRCERGGKKLTLKECERYEESKKQVSPPIGEEDPKSEGTTLTASQLATIKSEAQAYGTFHSPTAPYHCPTSMNELEGVKLLTSTTSPRAPVYIEGCGAVKITANGTANTEESPGFLVVANGTLELSGTSTYYGVIYAANLQKSSGAVVSLKGKTLVVGGIIVDGEGGIEFGSSGQGQKKYANLEFDSLAIENLTISAGAASTRNSFRILPAGQ